MTLQERMGLPPEGWTPFKELTGQDLISFASEIHSEYMNKIDFSADQAQVYVRLFTIKSIIDNYKNLTNPKEIEKAEISLIQTLHWFNNNSKIKYNEQPAT